jgi:uncharacterized membrane protein
MRPDPAPVLSRRDRRRHGTLAIVRGEPPRRPRVTSPRRSDMVQPIPLRRLFVPGGVALAASIVACAAGDTQRTASTGSTTGSSEGGASESSSAAGAGGAGGSAAGGAAGGESAGGAGVGGAGGGSGGMFGAPHVVPAGVGRFYMLRVAKGCASSSATATARSNPRRRPSPWFNRGAAPIACTAWLSRT